MSEGWKITLTKDGEVIDIAEGEAAAAKLANKLSSRWFNRGTLLPPEKKRRAHGEIKEMARRLNVTPGKVHRLLKRGQLSVSA
jgi:hypothetical protein